MRVVLHWTIWHRVNHNSQRYRYRGPAMSRCVIKMDSQLCATRSRRGRPSRCPDFHTKNEDERVQFVKIKQKKTSNFSNFLTFLHVDRDFVSCLVGAAVLRLKFPILSFHSPKTTYQIVNKLYSHLPPDTRRRLCRPLIRLRPHHPFTIAWN